VQKTTGLLFYVIGLCLPELHKFIESNKQNLNFLIFVQSNIRFKKNKQMKSLLKNVQSAMPTVLRFIASLCRCEHRSKMPPQLSDFV